MVELSRECLEFIVESIANAPEREAEPHVRDEAKEALASGLIYLSDMQLFYLIQRVGDREVHCEISPFMRALCNLKQFYSRQN